MTATALLDQPARAASIAVLDLEMTGLRADADRVVEIAVVRADGSEVLLEFQSLVRPPISMSEGAIRVSGITPDMLVGAPAFADVAAKVHEVLKNAVLIAHNVPHDLSFLDRELAASGLDLGLAVSVDTLTMARRLFAFPRNNLMTVCEQLGIQLVGHHRAMADARATFAAYHEMLDILDPEARLTVGDLSEMLEALAPNSPMRLRQARLLRDSFRQRRTVIIGYASAGDPREGVTRREVAIWRLKSSKIQGWCHLRQADRVFRMDRIHSVEPGDKTYVIPTHRRRV